MVPKTLRSLTIDNSGHDRFSVNSDPGCLGIPDHLKDLYQRTVKGMSEEQYSQVTNLLVEYQDIFARNADGVSVDLKNVEVVQDWPVPKTKKDPESCLGFTNYHREHVKQYAAVAAPLPELTGGQKEFFWEQRHQEAFENEPDICTQYRMR